MANDEQRTPAAIIETLLLAAGFLIEETSPELARRIEPGRENLEARIELVEQTAAELAAIAATARKFLWQVRD
ncbi:hypothetical protein GRI89_17435 [Altererythrobacter salegens]|uniref:Uncharacterized protein n=1 Tax=Croceibacterium salegens TaxID=1737568 RepID=A0A6I4T166_9SPHN|nr:hypothetical protein [Croceibacterium salegens]MXO61329.1 hypothetical protein [Croceibacterium salegens]